MKKVLTAALLACIIAFASQSAFAGTHHPLLPTGLAGTHVAQVPYGDDGGSH